MIAFMERFREPKIREIGNSWAIAKSKSLQTSAKNIEQKHRDPNIQGWWEALFCFAFLIQSKHTVSYQELWNKLLEDILS